DKPRQAALQKLKNEKHHQQASFSAFVKKNTTAVAVTYKIAHILLKRGKPFSDVEMIKECIVKAVVLQDTLDRTIAIVNYIRVNALRHRESRQMLTLDEETYSVDLPYSCKLAKMLNEQKCENKTFVEYVSVLDSLIEEYTDRFSDFDEHTPAMKLVFEPHLVDLSEAPTELQMELF
ncbi:hypothetical protein CBL_02913, partial [Carabus blaptoides fortunei]